MSTPDLPDLHAQWGRVVEECAKINPNVARMLTIQTGSNPISVEGNVVTVGVGSDFQQKALHSLSDSAADALTQAIRTVFEDYEDNIPDLVFHWHSA